MDNNTKEQLDNFRSHLTLIKSLDDQSKNDQYCKLIEKVEGLVGSLHPNIAKYYYEYAAYLMSKIQNQMDFLNAGAVPQGQQNDYIEDIPEVFQDDSDLQNNGGQQQKKQKINQNEQKPIFQDNNVQIYEDKPFVKQRMSQPGNPQRIQQTIEQKSQKQQINQNHQSQQQQDINDFQICYQNFACALHLYQQQHKKILQGQQTILPQDQIQRGIIAIHSKLGDLYMMEEKFQDAIDQYNKLIKFQSQKEGYQSNRGIAESHYMIGNCLLHENKPGCQKQAIREHIQTVRILLKHMQTEYHYDISAFSIPTQYQVKVNREPYLSYAADSPQVKDLKEVISTILDKIEDTYQQARQSEIYQKQKQKMNKNKEENTFKQVSKDVKVTNLGTFGNRKRNPNAENISPNQQVTIIMTPKQQNKMKQAINPTLEQNQKISEEKTASSLQKQKLSEEKTKQTSTVSSQVTPQ